MARVRFTPLLQRFFPDLADLELPAPTVAALFSALEERHPGLRGYLTDDQGALRQHVMVWIGESPVTDRARLSDALAPGDQVRIYQALSGG